MKLVIITGTDTALFCELDDSAMLCYWL